MAPRNRTVEAKINYDQVIYSTRRFLGPSLPQTELQSGGAGERNTSDYSETGREKVTVKLWFENCKLQDQTRVHVQKMSNRIHALNQTHG